MMYDVTAIGNTGKRVRLVKNVSKSNAQDRVKGLVTFGYTNIKVEPHDPNRNHDTTTIGR